MKKLLLLLSVFTITLSSCFQSSEVDVSLLPVKSGEKWGYINQKGNYEINPQFKSAYGFVSGLAKVVTNDNKVGYINKKGDFVIPAIYKEGTHFFEGKAFVVAPGERPKCIDKKGNILFSLETTEYVFPFSEGLAKIGIETSKNEVLWGFCDENGKIVINPQYEDAMSFSEGLAAVVVDGKFGFIDKSGKIVINPQFKVVLSFTDGLACFCDGKQWGFIDKKGNYAINPQFDIAFSFSEDLALAATGGKFGYIDKKGKFIINPQFVMGDDFSNGLAVCMQGNKFGYINKKGQFLITPQFDAAFPMIKKMSIIASNDKWGIINDKGNFIVNPSFEKIYEPSVFNVDALFEYVWFDEYLADYCEEWLSDKMDYEDLYNIFSYYSIMDDDEFITSDYYDASEFVNKFFEVISEKNFGNFTAKTTLQDIVDDDLFGKYAECKGEGHNSSNMYNYLASCTFRTKVTEDISISHVDFFFKNPIFWSDNNKHLIESDQLDSYEATTKATSSPFYHFDEKLCGISYRIDLRGDATNHTEAIEEAIKKHISEKCKINFTTRKLNEYQQTETAITDQLCFSFYSTKDISGESWIYLYITFSKENLLEWEKIEEDNTVYLG